MTVYHISYLNILINNINSINLGNEIETILTAGTIRIMKFYCVIDLKILACMWRRNVVVRKPEDSRSFERLVSRREIILTFKAQRFLYVPPYLTLRNSTWCSLCFHCFVLISEQTATFALYIINWLVFATVVESVYSAVRTDFLYKANYFSSLKD